ncbi:hypothetical protein SBA3_2580009 [Candidatus Sulfopaludibacter sp. SbA3]|nr:hypothetical protein SBA3_2580009 [Candidatus Sulfopaludibacter sp. SbA3]
MHYVWQPQDRFVNAALMFATRIDCMDPTGLTAIAGLLTSLRAIVGMAKDVNEAEFNGKLIDIQQRVLDVQAKFAALQSENFELKETVAELQAAIRRKEEMRFANGAYYTSDSGPFCQLCWEADQKAIRMCRLMPDPDSEPVTDDDQLVYYTCGYHASIRVLWPLSPSKYIAKLNAST